MGDDSLYEAVNFILDLCSGSNKEDITFKPFIDDSRILFLRRI